MSKIFQLVVLPEHAADSAKIISYVRHQDGSIKKDDTVVILKKSIDARQKQVKMNLKVEIFGKDEKIPERFVPKVYKNVADAKKVIVVGAGPAGLFAALRLIQEDSNLLSSSVDLTFKQEEEI
jgi:uncharacterized FAD-dependent dehydrogenase